MKRLLSLLVVASLFVVSFGCSQPTSAPKSDAGAGATGSTDAGAADAGAADEGAADGAAGGSESAGATE